MPVTEGAPSHGSPSDLLPPSWKSVIPLWLAEDTPSFDYGGFVVGHSPAVAHLLAKSPGVLAGVPFFEAIFSYLDCTVEWHFTEGADVFTSGKKEHVATVRGPVRNLLLGERVALNVLARCSGVASQSAKMLRLLREAGYKNTLAGTRKTTPGFRLVEKYGMLVAGCDAHRIDLSTMTMLKDNHVWACGGSIGKAVAAAKSAGGFSVKVEVECQSLEEAETAIQSGADVVMLDNFTPEGMKEAAKAIKEKYGRGPRAVLVEVSGGLTEDNVGGYVCDDVDVISSSSIHQGVKHVDFSLKVIPKQADGTGEAKKFGESMEQ
ncbi:nicotinate-nucleotide pyrophosphorylase [Elsinoe australis]|uniref:Nicotinate-nucleotide pyrophosphorylase [carboxylating] n=1 Tax=Elsinoe australis TaxID=40998 RepID=A0A4U7B5V9_9PEZI|nr:nicotinate-nucleotide pyrophosphorylase [Elsinoe australis]